MAFSALLLVALLSGNSDPPGDRAPGPIEQAVIEHRCAGARTGPSLATDPYHDCLAAQLAVLRRDFGPDLKDLSASERRTLDRACTRLRAFEGRERYIACLSARLAALHDAGSVGSPVIHADSASGVAPATSAVRTSPTATDTATGAQPSRAALWIVVAFAVVAGLGSAAYLLFRSRPRRATTCRTCGAFTSKGDLCSRCRHEAAEALRRAAAARRQQSV